MRTADFDFHLPRELIAQKPAAKRDESRLLVLHRASGKIEHRIFPDLLNYFQPGDLLVLNNSRVIRARLHGRNAQTKGKFEILLLEENATNDWWTMIRPGKRARIGTKIFFPSASRSNEAHFLEAAVTEKNSEGHCRLQFSGVTNLKDALDEFGEMPLPPYISRTDGELPEDTERYQTVFAKTSGSIAAPTAGLHFTETFLKQLRAHGVEVCFVTLHTGLGTFLPVKTENIVEHKMHEERYELSPETAEKINRAKEQKRRVIGVGTTTARVLESTALSFGVPPSGGRMPGKWEPPEGGTPNALAAETGRTKIFIFPPYSFNIVDALLTNFHLPCSTLLMLVSAFAAPNETRGREMILSAYAEAIRERYRFFSYGDAMLIV